MTGVCTGSDSSRAWNVAEIQEADAGISRFRRWNWNVQANVMVDISPDVNDNTSLMF